eukprot:jgi/Phyca11/108911/e_gw1.16.777.1
MKRIKKRLGGVRTITLNDVYELQYCADTGLDSCLLSRNNFNELVRLDDNVKSVPLSTPVIGKSVGGHDVEARESVLLAIRLHTASGPAELAEPVNCLIIEQIDDEFIVGNDVLLSLGINVDRQLEQLAGGKLRDDEDPIVSDDELRPGHANDFDIQEGLENLFSAALDNGFPVEYMEELRRIAKKHDIWRLVPCDDPPAKVPPYKLRLKQDAKPFRCKARQYGPLQSAFLKEFNQTLVDLGWVYKNPSSHWACAALPLKKPKAISFAKLWITSH